jgi:hypothetical protein
VAKKGMTDEYKAEGKWNKKAVAILMYYPGICLEGLRKTTRI